MPFLLIFIQINDDFFIYFLFGDALENFVILIFWVIVFLLIILYFVNYKLLSPLKTIQKGINKIVKGNLGFQFQIKKKDEFGNIMQSFNKMTKNISDLLEAKSQLLIDLSHEFKTPLTRAKLSLENLPKTKYVVFIQEDLKEIEEIMHTILEAEKYDKAKIKVKLEKIPLKEVMLEIINYHKNRDVPIEYKDYLPKKNFFLNKTHLKIISSNLIQNAFNYSSDSIFVSTKILNNHFILEVQDYGIGIAEEEIPKITDAFYQVNKSRYKKHKGYGLGLNICKRIINIYQGKMQIQSQLKKGTLVKVILPIKE